MKALLYVLTALTVIGLAFWAYVENDRTRTALGRLQALQADVGTAHARLNVLRAEWAYLNRPDRLRALVDMNFDRLGLLPLRAEQFRDVGQLAFRSAPAGLVVSDPVEVMQRREVPE